MKVQRFVAIPATGPLPVQIADSTTYGIERKKCNTFHGTPAPLPFQGALGIRNGVRNLRGTPDKLIPRVERSGIPPNYHVEFHVHFHTTPRRLPRRLPRRIPRRLPRRIPRGTPRPSCKCVRTYVR